MAFVHDYGNIGRREEGREGEEEKSERRDKRARREAKAEERKTKITREKGPVIGAQCLWGSRLTARKRGERHVGDPGSPVCLLSRLSSPVIG